MYTMPHKTHSYSNASCLLSSRMFCWHCICADRVCSEKTIPLNCLQISNHEKTIFSVTVYLQGKQLETQPPPAPLQLHWAFSFLMLTVISSVLILQPPRRHFFLFSWHPGTARVSPRAVTWRGCEWVTWLPRWTDPNTSDGNSSGTSCATPLSKIITGLSKGVKLVPHGSCQTWWELVFYPPAT